MEAIEEELVQYSAKMVTPVSEYLPKDLSCSVAIEDSNGREKEFHVNCSLNVIISCSANNLFPCVTLLCFAMSTTCDIMFSFINFLEATKHRLH